MNKKFIVFLSLISCYYFSKAQIKDTTFWNRNFEVGVNINQAAFNGSWQSTQGGSNSFVIAAFLFAKSDYTQFKSNVLNDLQLQYGKTYNDIIFDYLGGNQWRKNIDRIFFDNKYSYGITPTLGIFGSVVFQSQFDEGLRFEKTKVNNPGSDSAVVISNFLAPGYLDEAAGIEWKPVPYFSLRLGAVAFRQSFSINNYVTQSITKPDGTHHGVGEGLKVKNEFGLNALAKFDKDLATNINLKVIGQYFTAYENLRVGTVRFDAVFTAKITRFINVNLSGVFLYNPYQIERWQITEAMAVGVVYKLTNIPK